MKNFSAKNVQFTNLSISGEAPVSQGDIGTAPNQIPLNKDLGSLAYMNAPQIEDLNVDTLELREIAAEMSDTAVDVFVYDTRKDSDGGAWRSRTQHTSWYNEELNTATRGGRREFPAVAVIVTENDKVTIYDGDDPDLPMWMVFQSGGAFGSGNAQLIGNSTTLQVTSLMLDGILTTCNSNSYHALLTINFLSETSQAFRDSGNYIIPHNIAERHVGDLGVPSFSGSAIVNSTVNDVAMTVLPNAPIDDNTGLPIPTIAVATDGGVSVIRDDGSVVDITSGGYSHIDITNNRIWVSRSDTDIIETGPFPDSDTSNASWRETSYNDSSSVPSLVGVSQAGMPVIQNYVGNNGGLTYVSEEINNLSNSMVSYTTSSYNTGWMPGDTKLATLSDTKIETVGVYESTELVTNGTFDSDVSGWTNIDTSGSPDATITWSNGTAQVFRPTGQSGRFYQAIDTIVGAEYFIQIGNYGGSNGGVFVADSDDASSWNIIANNGQVIQDNNKHYFTATTTSTYIILNSALENQSVTFDDIFVKRSGELITNGTFDNGTTGWEQNDADSFTVNALGEAVITSTTGATWQTVYQDITTVIGKRYTVSVDVLSNTNLVDLWVGTSGTGSFADRSSLGPADGNIDGTGRFSATITATTSSTFINLAVYNGTGSFDNISVRLAEDDRSVNDNGLQIFGEITKTPVAPGADLVAYSGFSANNYLMQPYNSDLDFGTGDFSIIGWVNKNSTNTQVVLNSGDGSSSRLYIYISSINELRFAAGGTGTNTYGSIGSDSIWNQIAIVRKDGVVYGYINGVLQASYSNPDAVTHSSNDTLKIGLDTTGLYPFGGSLSLIRLTATSITPDQIAKIYRDEKVLFTDGAQATLYGTSDAVTALSYDDKAEQLHVGTSSGRSDFSGLRRINNTTTAVTTSISASNNLIAEQ